MRILTPFTALLIPCLLLAQVQRYPYTENFDSVPTPLLPSGWTTTTNRSAGGDFTTTASTALSDSHAVLSTNAVIPQSLTSPTLDFSGTSADSLVFFERRSSSHNSGVLLEASADGGTRFDFRLSDTLRNPGTTSYVARRIRLPSNLDDKNGVRIRWQVLGNGTGTSGTIRFDDIRVTVRHRVDAAIGSVVFSPAVPVAGEPLTVSVTVRNAGTMPFSGASIGVSDDANADTLPEPEELLSSASIDKTIQASDSATVQIPLHDLSSGSHRLIVSVRLEGDQDTINNVLPVPVIIGFAGRPIVINEIMYDPRPGEAEYVELFNRSTVAVDLANWRLGDKKDTSGRSTAQIISRLPLVVSGPGFVVVATDSIIFRTFSYLRDPEYSVELRSGAFSLNNTGDNLILSDPSGTTVDSVRYSPEWHNPEVEDPAGRSLERINPDLGSNDRRNWSTSANPFGGTPDRQNSLYTVSLPDASALTFSPNPFSPDGDSSSAFLPCYAESTKTARFEVSAGVEDTR